MSVIIILNLSSNLTFSQHYTLKSTKMLGPPYKLMIEIERKKVGMEDLYSLL